MKKNLSLYCIIDRVGSSPVSAPIVCVNDAVAIRGFKSYCEDEKIPFHKDELDLVHMCEVTDNMTVLEPVKEYVVCTGNDYDEVYREFVSSMNGEE